MKISEIITDKYKLRIPPTIYYDLLADVREVEEEPPYKNDLGVDCIDEFTKCKHKCIDNDLAVDCISREQALEAIDTWDKFGYSARYGLERLDKDDKGYVPYVRYEDIVNCIKNLPSVTPQEPQTFKWCTDCKEYDQEKHCCHRWSKVIRDTVEEMKQEQEPILDKIRAEIETKYGQCDICEYFEDYDYEENDISEYRPIGNIADILQMFDKYKSEKEQE